MTDGRSVCGQPRLLRVTDPQRSSQSPRKTTNVLARVSSWTLKTADGSLRVLTISVMGPSHTTSSDVRSAWRLTRLTSVVTGPGWSHPAPTLEPSPGPSPSSHPGQRRPGASTQEQPTLPSPPSRASPASSPPEPPDLSRDLSGLVKCLRRMLRGIAVRIVFQTS
jgi:hypothetical protein